MRIVDANIKKENSSTRPPSNTGNTQAVRDANQVKQGWESLVQGGRGDVGGVRRVGVGKGRKD